MRKAHVSLNSMDKLEIEAGKIDERLLEAAKTKLPGVLQTCNGIDAPSPARGGQQQPSGSASSLKDWTRDAMRHQTDMIQQLSGNREEKAQTRF